MSIFASRTTQTIELPFDPPHTVTIRKLAGRHLEAAHREYLFQTIENVKRMGGPAFQRELTAVVQAVDPEDRPTEGGPTAPNPLAGVDVLELLVRGVVAWSYSEPISREMLEDLDDDAAEFIARAILRLTKPSLFETAEEAEASAKNG